MIVSDLLRAVDGRLTAGLAAARFDGVCTDTRKIATGNLFVALTGEKFDGNAFVDEALAAGAAAVVCERPPTDPGTAAIVVVSDALRALGDLAAAHRNRFDLPVVGITGSNGKTTTKELLRVILAEAWGEDRVLANKGNFNNLIGMPLTLLQLSSEHRVAVLEMGMNAFGEIARLTEIARPTHAMITMIGSAHLEGVGSVEGVARAKGELFAGLEAGATVLINTDDARVAALGRAFPGKKLSYGSRGEVRADAIVARGFDGTTFRLVVPSGAVAIDLPLSGGHNVTNATAATACAIVLGVDTQTVARGLANAVPPPMRLAPEMLKNGVLVVDDSYNANPDSLRASLDTLAECAAGRCIVVLGDMLELGDDAERVHEEAGAAAAAISPLLVCAVGDYADAIRRGAVAAGLDPKTARACRDQRVAAEAVAELWTEGDTVLVKGSRGSAMERVIDALRTAAS